MRTRVVRICHLESGAEVLRVQRLVTGMIGVATYWENVKDWPHGDLQSANKHAQALSGPNLPVVIAEYEDGKLA